MWLNTLHLRNCLTKTGSVNPVQFLGTFITMCSPLGALVLFKNYANSLYFCFLSRGVSLSNGLQLKRCFMENILLRVMCEYKEVMNTAIRLNESGFV